MSEYQRPTEIIPGLRSKSVWDFDDLDKETKKMVQKLQTNWQKILAEATELKEVESEWQEEKNVLESGKWNQLQWNCSITPFTCLIVSAINATFCPTCVTMWSVLGPNSHIGSHCGPTNARLRVHLGLKVIEDIWALGLLFYEFLL